MLFMAAIFLAFHREVIDLLIDVLQTFSSTFLIKSLLIYLLNCFIFLQTGRDDWASPKGCWALGGKLQST